jgi:two-component system chemotaxis family response regulator WspR
MDDPISPSTDSFEHDEFRVRALLVDDQPIIGEAVRRMCAPHADIEFSFVSDAASAQEAARAFRPTVILQDLVMPGTDGFTLLQAYRDDPALRDVPVIMLSSMEEPLVKANGFALGASDYLVKLPDQVELLARVRHHSRGYISAKQRDAAFALLRASRQELTRVNDELRKLVALDGLTGIGNRRRFDDALAMEWQRSRRHATPLALVLCDVDHFKLYNDHFGHPAGDLCLKRVAAVLNGQIKRPTDLAARYGGEEFALLLPQTDLDGALLLADACRVALEGLALPHPETKHGLVTMSMGVVSLQAGEDGSGQDLIHAADAALYEAKRSGRNRVAAAT